MAYLSSWSTRTSNRAFQQYQPFIHIFSLSMQFRAQHPATPSSISPPHAIEHPSLPKPSLIHSTRNKSPTACFRCCTTTTIIIPTILHTQPTSHASCTYLPFHHSSILQHCLTAQSVFRMECRLSLMISDEEWSRGEQHRAPRFFDSTVWIVSQSSRVPKRRNDLRADWTLSGEALESTHLITAGD